MRLFTVLCLFVLGVWASNPYLKEQGIKPMIADNTEHAVANVCWKDLSCSIKEIEGMNMKNRLQFVKYMGVRQFADLASSEEFRAVEGVMAFFIRRDIAKSGSWMSFVNAAVVEACERGAAIALGISNYTGGNPGTVKWVEFFEQRAKGHLTNRNAHDVAWAVAEQTAIDYGTRVADTEPGVDKPPGREARWSKFTQLYRTLMKYRRTILWVIKFAFAFTDPAIPMATEAFVDWFTDVTDETSTGFLADVAWALSALGFSLDGEDPEADSEVLMHIITEFKEAFQYRDDLEDDAHRKGGLGRQDL